MGTIHGGDEPPTAARPEARGAHESSDAIAADGDAART
jgi:hypothetical protein